MDDKKQSFDKFDHYEGGWRRIEQQQIMIIKKYIDLGYSEREISKKLDIGKGTIWRIKKGYLTI